MRTGSGVFLGLTLSLLWFSAFSSRASAADLKIKVRDPQSAAVVGAQVALLGSGGRILAVQATSAEGIAVVDFEDKVRIKCRRVLAPGFAPARRRCLSRRLNYTIDLHLAVGAETVVVSATRTLVPAESAGADVDALNGEQLKTMLPVAADDAVRFLPGAVVQRSGTARRVGVVVRARRRIKLQQGNC